MPIRLPGTSPSQTEIKSTTDANGQEIPHVNVDSAITVDMAAVVAELVAINASLAPDRNVPPRVITFNRDVNGYITSITDAVHTWTFARDVNHRITSITVT